ncbi:MAG: hypothetical protein LH702_28600 [Phormidesmis sp. CAN_BIN44]|nr:hypothetical protein [Phormidesmis sp. CAN_BIN44]
MNAADFQSGHDRRHNDPPNLWLAVLAGSLVVHLLLLLSGRLFLFRVTSQKPAGVATSIELVDISPKSSNKTTRSTRSSASNVITAPAAAQRAVSSEAAPQRVAPIQPSIVQSPIPIPTPQIKPSIRPTITPSIVASTPKSQPFPSVRPAPPTVPDTIAPEQPTSPNPEPTSANTGDRPTSPDANSIASPGSADANNTPSAVPDSSTNDSGKEPSTPGPTGSDQTLSSELSVESSIGRLAKSGSQTSGKSAILQDRPTQILSIQFPPALKLAPNQTLDLTVLVVIDNTSGKVLSSDVLPESRAFQEIPGLNQDDLNSVVGRIFRNLTFKVDVETGPGAIAPQSPWKVPVKITVIK